MVLAIPSYHSGRANNLFFAWGLVPRDTCRSSHTLVSWYLRPMDSLHDLWLNWVATWVCGAAARLRL